MNNNDILELLVDSGALSYYPSRQSLMGNSPIIGNVDKPDDPTDPVVKFVNGEITKSEVCRILDIKEHNLTAYLVEHGKLFSL